MTELSAEHGINNEVYGAAECYHHIADIGHEPSFDLQVAEFDEANLQCPEDLRYHRDDIRYEANDDDRDDD